MSDVEMWGYPEAAQYLHVSVSHLRKLVMWRRVPCYRPFGLKGRVLFDPGEVQEFVRQARVDSAGPA